MERFLRPQAVYERVGLRDSAVRELVKANRFPKPVYIGSGECQRRVWPESEIELWINARIRERDDQLLAA